MSKRVVFSSFNSERFFSSRKIAFGFGFSFFLCAVFACGFAVGAPADENSTAANAAASDDRPNAEEALRRLKEGNARFLADKTVHPHSGFLRLKQTADFGQHPFATILGCSDSRAPVELLFDQGFGDIFTIRVAGNICANDEMGSVEYAVAHLKTPLLVVLGHSKCGAVTATVEHEAAGGHVKGMLRRIVPAVERAQKSNENLSEEELIERAVVENVRVAIETILDESEIVREAVDEGRLTIVPAIYDISTGQIEWFDETEKDATQAESAK